MQAGHQKRRPAGDGMDAEMDDPELMFEMTTGHHLGDCQCACDHVVYSPTAYTTCLQQVGLDGIETSSISNCRAFEDKDLHLLLNANRATDSVRMISGNVTLGSNVDDKAEINLRGSSTSSSDQDALSAIGKCFSSSPAEYINLIHPRESDSFRSVCPIPSSIYEINEALPCLTVIDLPYAKPGSVEME